MLSKCANPDCPSKLRYLRAGKLYFRECKGNAATTRPEAGLADAGRSRTISCAWLCSLCCRDTKVYIDDDGDVRIVRANKRESFSDSIYEERIHLAERELSSFVAAVRKLYGLQQARLSALDWLNELESIDSSSMCTEEKWRTVTIAASARLADRMNPEQRSSGLSTRRSGGSGRC